GSRADQFGHRATPTTTAGRGPTLCISDHRPLHSRDRAPTGLYGAVLREHTPAGRVRSVGSVADRLARGQYTVDQYGALSVRFGSGGQHGRVPYPFPGGDRSCAWGL